MNKTLYTIGYELYDFDSFIDELKQHGIEVVIDIRYNHNIAKFCKQDLIKILDKNKIQYTYLKEIGIPPSIRKEYDSKQKLLKYYKESILPCVSMSIDIINKIALEKTACLLCMENNPSECHRSIVSAYMKKQYGYAIRHIKKETITNTGVTQLSLF